jgi:hypothetical protein
MRELREFMVFVAILAMSQTAWSQEAETPQPEASAEEAEEPARPTGIAVIASGSAEVNEVILSQARTAAVGVITLDQGRHGRAARREEDPGLTVRAAECEDNECFSAVARDAQVRFLFVLLVSRSDAGGLASVMLTDAEAGQIVGSAAVDLPADPAGFAEAMREPLGPLLAAIPPIGPTTGRLTVAANQVGAAVFVDGERVGSTPLEPLNDLDAGEHQVRVAFEGFEDYSTTVDVPAGGEVAVEADLQPTTTEAVVIETPIWRRWWFWTIVGGAVVVTGAAVGLGVGLSGSAGSNQEWGVPFPSYE